MDTCVAEHFRVIRDLFQGIAIWFSHFQLSIFHFQLFFLYPCVMQNISETIEASSARHFSVLQTFWTPSTLILDRSDWSDRSD